MPATAIIPARLGSTRFPGKALAAKTGKPMVVHVCERAASAASVGRVVVATDAEEIASAVRAAGFEAVMTRPEHTNGTSRIGEAADALGLAADAVVVNVQGDEPEIEPSLIDAAVGALDHRISEAPDWAPMAATVAAPFREGEDPADPNIVKALVGLWDGPERTGPALTFTRANAPYPRDPSAAAKPLKHLGLYGYTVASLRIYLRLRPTPLEQTEMLEQLRWLEHALPIAVAVRESAHHGIDTPEQYAAFVERYRAQATARG